jgi:hypothetical protein
MKIFVIEDERHAEPQAKFACFADAVAELRLRSRIPWDEPPNHAPCTSWRTCGRVYEVIEYDDAQERWKEVRHIPALEISATGVKWAQEFDEAAGSSASA